MTRWKDVVFGALAFVGAHAVEAAAWRSWFAPGGDYAAWFLNSGRAVAFTAVCLFVVSLLGSALGAADQRDSLVRGAYFSGGAVASMTVVLIVVGPGTIWPIVLVGGAAIISACAVAGAYAGGAIRRAGRP
ncbi:MAG: hypothetical protein LAO77_20340 [Acidobacteriia bacterium]|nr:hypothetical protein [Terriglobia bacterium]